VKKAQRRILITFYSVASQVEQGKSLNIALKREIREELGAEVEVKEFFMHPFSFYYSEDEDGFEGCIKLFPMLCTLRVDSPDPSAREGVHDNLNWVTADTLDQYDMLGADMLIVEKILLEHYDRCSSRSQWIRGDGRSV
jgi:8-oxo-dGTP pyrophosphatase MutT (NUDIX family)